MVFQCINIRQVPWEVLKIAASGLGFQDLPRDLANVYARKTIFDPYIRSLKNWTYKAPSDLIQFVIRRRLHSNETNIKDIHSYNE